MKVKKFKLVIAGGLALGTGIFGYECYRLNELFSNSKALTPIEKFFSSDSVCSYELSVIRLYRYLKPSSTAVLVRNLKDESCRLEGLTHTLDSKPEKLCDAAENKASCIKRLLGVIAQRRPLTASGMMWLEKYFFAKHAKNKLQLLDLVLTAIELQRSVPYSIDRPEFVVFKTSTDKHTLDELRVLDAFEREAGAKIYYNMAVRLTGIMKGAEEQSALPVRAVAEVQLPDAGPTPEAQALAALKQRYTRFTADIDYPNTTGETGARKIFDEFHGNHPSPEAKGK